MYLLDTTVISELRKLERSRRVVEWIRGVPPDELFLSVMTIGEIAKRIAKERRVGTPEATSQAEALQAWLEGLLAAHANRILGIDVGVATRWGRLCDAHPRFPTEMLLAAVALDQGLTIATRNVDRFRSTGVSVINPFVAIP